MKCKQKLCSRNKSIQVSGNCQVCESVILEHIKTFQNKKKEVVKKVEVDLQLMVNTHSQIARGIKVDQEVVSNLLLGGVINILHQHDTIDEMDERIKSVEQIITTDKLRIELLENWTKKQAEELKELQDKVEISVLNDSLATKIDAVEKEIISVRNQISQEAAKDPENSKKELSLCCNHCDKTFSKAIQLELHMEEHSLVKNYSCDICAKEFHLKWRLEKHVQIHSENFSAQHCHYFNNRKDCPFRSAGCMFKHERSGHCLIKNCSRKLCQFEHSDTILEEEICDVDEEESNAEDEEYPELAANQCHLCRKHCESRDDNIEHVKNEHTEYYEGIVEMAASMKNNQPSLLD